MAMERRRSSRRRLASDDDVPPLHAATASAIGMRSAPARPAIRVTIMSVGSPRRPVRIAGPVR